MIHRALIEERVLYGSCLIEGSALVTHHPIGELLIERSEIYRDTPLRRSLLWWAKVWERRAIFTAACIAASIRTASRGV